MVAVGAVASTAPAGEQVGLEASRLRAHVRQQVDRGLLHVGVLGGAGPRSWMASRPQDHWTVPAPKTSAPLGAR